MALFITTPPIGVSVHLEGDGVWGVWGTGTHELPSAWLGGTQNEVAELNQLPCNWSIHSLSDAQKGGAAGAYRQMQQHKADDKGPFVVVEHLGGLIGVTVLLPDVNFDKTRSAFHGFLSSQSVSSLITVSGHAFMSEGIAIAKHMALEKFLRGEPATSTEIAFTWRGDGISNRRHEN